MDTSKIKDSTKKDIVRLINNEKVDVDKIEDIPDKFLLHAVMDVIDLNKQYSETQLECN